MPAPPLLPQWLKNFRLEEVAVTVASDREIVNAEICHNFGSTAAFERKIVYNLPELLRKVCIKEKYTFM